MTKYLATDEVNSKTNCCSDGFYNDDGVCTEATNDGTVGCKRLSDLDTCIELEYETSCDNGYYFTLDHCCLEGKYWDVVNSTCSAVSTIS